MLMLSQLKTKPVAVVTFAGLAKTGKSYLANQFVKSLGGFRLSHMSGEATQGIWIWSKPIQISEELDALVLDC